MKQMKSSQEGSPENMSYTFPAMSGEMNEMMKKVSDLPAFFLILFIDESDELQWWGGIRSEFPKNRLEEGLVLLQANGLSNKVALADELSLPPKMTVDMFNQLCAIRTRPAYFAIIYVEGDELKTWAEMREGFPEESIAQGIAMAKNRFVTNWIDHYKPAAEGEENPLLAKLRTMAKERA